MTLEEKLRAYAAKGELVHLSLAYSNGAFHCNYAAASPAGGYSRATGNDPVEAIEKALKASPAKPARVSKRDTATVNEPIVMDESAEHLAQVDAALARSKKTGRPYGEVMDELDHDAKLKSEWTTP